MITCVGAGIVDPWVITVIIRIFLALQLYHRSWSDVNFFFFVSPTISSIVVYQEKILNQNKTCFSKQSNLPKQLLSPRSTERQGFMVQTMLRDVLSGLARKYYFRNVELLLAVSCELWGVRCELTWSWRRQRRKWSGCGWWVLSHCHSGWHFTAPVCHLMSSHLSQPPGHFSLKQPDLGWIIQSPVSSLQCSLRFYWSLNCWCVWYATQNM